MKTIIVICTLLGAIAVAQAEDFYTANESLLNAGRLEQVKKNALAELRAHRDSLEASYFMAMVTLRQTSQADSSKVNADNGYVDKFAALYRQSVQNPGQIYFS